MPKQDVVQTLNTWKDGKRLAVAAQESGMGDDDLASLIRNTMVAVRNRMKDKMQPESEWADRVTKRLEALETKTDNQTAEFRLLLVALNQFIELCHPGRFSERLRLVKPDMDSGQETVATVRADEIQKHMNKAEEARQRHDELMMIAEIVERANTAPEKERFLPRVEMTTCDTAQD